MASPGDDKDRDEEQELEKKLKLFPCRKKEVFDNTKSADKKLWEIRQEETAARDRLLQLRTDKIEREQRERHGGPGVGWNAEMEEMRRALEGFKIENGNLKELQAKQTKALETLRHQNSGLNTSLRNVKDAMQRVTRSSEIQQKEKEGLMRQVASLKDEISALRQLSSETQQRQLDELQSSSRTTKQQQQRQQHTGHADALRSVYSKVSAIIDAQSVARNMFECNALTLRELQLIQAKHKKPVKAAEQLVNIVISQSSNVYRCFLDALKKTGQQHVFEVVISDSCKDFDDRFDHTKTIRQHYVFLVDTLDVKHSGLVGELYQAEVLSREERETVNSEVMSFRQNEKLLFILSRKTKDQFDKFLHALDKTGQQHVRNHITGRQRQQQDNQETETEGATRQEDVTGSYQLMQQQLKQANETMATLLEQLGRLQQTTSEGASDSVSPRPVTSSDTDSDVPGEGASDSVSQPQRPRPVTSSDTDSDVPVTCSPYTHQIELMTRLTYTEQRAVFGVTILNNKIYVVHDELPLIVVYMSQQPYTRLPDISVNGLKYPVDIAAGSSCLYLSDRGSRAIWRVKAADSKVDQWLTGVWAVSVSVTSEEKLVLLVWVDGQGSVAERNVTWYCEIQIYSRGAVKETVIKLSRDITTPLCVVVTTRKTFIVSYGFPWHEMNRVCEVDMTGRMLKAFGSAPGEDVGQLNVPCHVSLDDEERVIVADTRNDRVLLLNKQLMLQRVLVTWHPRPDSHDAGGPVRLHYDSHSGRLLVGLDTGHVDIYQLRV